MHPGRPWVQINCTCWLPLTACINGNMLFGKCVPGLPLQALNATGSIYFLHVIMTYIGSMCAWLALQALDSIEADSELRVMDLIYILGAQIKPSPQFFAPKPITSLPKEHYNSRKVLTRLNSEVHEEHFIRKRMIKDAECIQLSDSLQGFRLACRAMQQAFLAMSNRRLFSRLATLFLEASTALGLRPTTAWGRSSSGAGT
eukprot:1161758-Pelagomonas_calceolata.AAC.1